MDSRLVSILMVTRNRPRSLEQCLARTRAVVPPTVRIVVFDDASAEPARIRAVVAAQPNTTLLRSETRVGPGESRNRCLQAADTRFCLSLDDDCFLDAVPDTTRWEADREADHDIAAVAYRYRNLPQGDLAPACNEPGESDFLLGGASLLRRDAMLRTGGYLGWLGFAREDTELTLRLRHLDYRIWYDPTVIVQHARSNEGREENREALWYVRNTLLIDTIHGLPGFGVLLGVCKALRLGLFRFKQPIATLAGVWAGLWLVPKCLRERAELLHRSRRCKFAGIQQN